MVGMAVAMLGKVEHDQRVTENLGRTGGNRTRRPNITELNFFAVGGGLVYVKANSHTQPFAYPEKESFLG